MMIIVRASDDLRRSLFTAGNVTEDGLKNAMPEWLQSSLAIGSTIFMDRQDYCDLPEEIVAHLEVISN